MNVETFEGYKIIKYDDGVYGYEMADGKAMKGFKSKIAAKSAAKKLASASAQPTPQVTPHELTEIEKQLAAELEKLYGDAVKYLTDKAKDFVSKYETGKQWDTEALKALIKQLTTQLAQTNADAVAAINGYAPIVAAAQANFTEYTIENGTTINPSFTLLNQDAVLCLVKDSPAVLPQAKAKIAKNKQWNTPKLRNALTRAIVQGDSIPKLTKEVENICGSNKAIATRNARTMMTGARNAGTLAAYVRAEQNGMHIQKQWMAALDERTRVSHRHLDGEIKPVKEKFSNGLMHPGDTTGRPAEVYNCRCTMVPIVNDQLYEGERANKLKDMSYEEWKAAQPKPKSKAKKKKKPQVDHLKNAVPQKSNVVQTQAPKKPKLTKTTSIPTSINGQPVDRSNVHDVDTSDYQPVPTSMRKTIGDEKEYDFKTWQSADGYVREKAGEVWRGASKEEKLVANGYTGSGYKLMNARLNGYEDGDYTTFQGLKKTTLAKGTKALTDMISRSTYDDAVVVYRRDAPNNLADFTGISVDDLNSMWRSKKEFDPNDFVGKSNRFMSFLSTSISQDMTYGTADSNKWVQFEIHCPAGSEMLYAEPFSQYGKGGNMWWNGWDTQKEAGEKEMILQRGAKYTITDIKRDKKVLRVVMELNLDEGYDKWGDE